MKAPLPCARLTATQGLLFCTGIALAVTAALAMIAPRKANHFYLGFDRVWDSGRWRVVDSLPLRGYSYRIAGNSDNLLALQVGQRPRELWWFGGSLGDSVHVRLNMPDTPVHENLLAQVHGLQVYLLAGNLPVIYRGRIGEWNMERWFSGTYFIEAAPLSHTAAAVMSRLQARATLGLIRTADTPKVWRRGLLEKQVDGFFDSFGHLLSEPDSGRMVYLYRYRNRFLVADTNVMLLYQNNTVDTISMAKIKAASLDSNTHTMSAPPMPVNRRAAIQRGKLYVQSNIRAANETLEDFVSHAVIDVYDLTARGRYLHSFHLPKRGGRHLTGFHPMPDGTIVALYDTELVRYRQ